MFDIESLNENEMVNDELRMKFNTLDEEYQLIKTASKLIMAATRKERNNIISFDEFFKIITTYEKRELRETDPCFKDADDEWLDKFGYNSIFSNEKNKKLLKENYKAIINFVNSTDEKNIFDMVKSQEMYLSKNNVPGELIDLVSYILDINNKNNMLIDDKVTPDHIAEHFVRIFPNVKFEQYTPEIVYEEGVEDYYGYAFVERRPGRKVIEDKSEFKNFMESGYDLYSGIEIKDMYNENYYDSAFVVTEFLNKYDDEAVMELNKHLKEYGIEINKKISISWIMVLKVLLALTSEGKAVIPTLRGSLQNVIDREIREQLIKKGYIEEIIELPSKLLPKTSIAIDLIVINKKGNSKGQVKFVDLKDCIIKESRRNRIDIFKAVKKYDDEKNEARIDTTDYSLDPTRYKKQDQLNLKKPMELGEITENIFRGYQITSKQLDDMLTLDEHKATYKLLEVGAINEKGEIVGKLKCINTNGKNLDKFLLKDGDYFISARGENIKKGIIRIKPDEKIISNGSLNIIRANENYLMPLFLKIFFESDIGNILLNRIKCGISISSINIDSLKKLQIECPSIEEQIIVTKKYEEKWQMVEETKNKLKKLEEELKKIANDIN